MKETFCNQKKQCMIDQFLKRITLFNMYTVDATKFVTAQIVATFQEGRGMENGKLTIISILQVLALGCLGRDFVGKQSKDAFSFCHK